MTTDAIDVNLERHITIIINKGRTKISTTWIPFPFFATKKKSWALTDRGFHSKREKIKWVYILNCSVLNIIHKGYYLLFLTQDTGKIPKHSTQTEHRHKERRNINLKYLRDNK